MKKVFFLVVSFFSIFLSSLHADVASDQRSLVIIKPEAVSEDHVGAILNRFEGVGLKIVALKMKEISKEEARAFYSALKSQSFFDALIDYITSGPLVAAVLQGPDVIAVERQIIGSTNPSNAEKGTIRKEFGKNIQMNAVHGSDSLESAAREIPFFFTPDEIYFKS